MTPSDAKMLAAIRRLSVGGVSPTYEDLRKACGLASRSSVHATIHRLAREGLLTLSPGRARTVEVVEGAVSVAVLCAMSDDALIQAIVHAEQILASRGRRVAQRTA